MTDREKLEELREFVRGSLKGANREYEFWKASEGFDCINTSYWRGVVSALKELRDKLRDSSLFEEK